MTPDEMFSRNILSESDLEDYYKDEALYQEAWQSEPGLPFNRYRARVKGMKGREIMWRGKLWVSRDEIVAWRESVIAQRDYQNNDYSWLPVNELFVDDIEQWQSDAWMDAKEMMYEIHKANPLWWFSEVMREWAGGVEGVERWCVKYMEKLKTA